MKQRAAYLVTTGPGEDIAQAGYHVVEVKVRADATEGQEVMVEHKTTVSWRGGKREKARWLRTCFPSPAQAWAKAHEWNAYEIRRHRLSLQDLLDAQRVIQKKLEEFAQAGHPFVLVRVEGGESI